MTVSLVDLKFQDTLFKPKTSDDTQSSIRSQVIVVEVHGQQLAFPSVWVDEVLYFPRQQILQLPFYQKPVVGLIPHQGGLVLLIELPGDTSVEVPSVGNKDYIRALQLSSQMGELAGTAIQIDRIVGTIDHADLEVQSALQLFEPEQLSIQSFQPYRWA